VRQNDTKNKRLRKKRGNAPRPKPTSTITNRRTNRPNQYNGSYGVGTDLMRFSNDVTQLKATIARLQQRKGSHQRNIAKKRKLIENLKLRIRFQEQKISDLEELVCFAQETINVCQKKILEG